MEESVASFQLNSSLVPGNVFNCHLELYLDKSDSGKRDEMDSERWEGGQINANHLGLLLHHVMARIIISLYVTLVAITCSGSSKLMLPKFMIDINNENQPTL